MSVALELIGNFCTGDMLTSDMLQSIRDTFNMLRDDACVWRLTAAKSLMNGLPDLPHIGSTVSMGSEDVENGVDETKAPDLHDRQDPTALVANPQLHQASAVRYYFVFHRFVPVKSCVLFICIFCDIMGPGNSACLSRSAHAPCAR